MFSLNKILISIALAVGFNVANAANIELKSSGSGFYDNELVQQSDYHYGEDFSVSTSGEYKLSLRDFVFPVRFDSIMVSVTQGTTELGRISLSSTGDTTGVSLFDLSKDSSYYFSLYSINSKSNPVALYGVDLSLTRPLIPSAVPLPAASLLLLSGLAGAAGFTKKRRVQS